MRIEIAPGVRLFVDVQGPQFLHHRGHGRSDRRPPEEWTLDTSAQAASSRR